MCGVWGEKEASYFSFPVASAFVSPRVAKEICARGTQQAPMSATKSFGTSWGAVSLLSVLRDCCVLCVQTVWHFSLGA